jgi:sugar lactone lactonase YvrE
MEVEGGSDDSSGARFCAKNQRQGSGLTIANGIGWNPDARAMYLDDSGTERRDLVAFWGGRGVNR